MAVITYSVFQESSVSGSVSTHQDRSPVQQDTPPSLSDTEPLSTHLSENVENDYIVGISDS